MGSITRRRTDQGWPRLTPALLFAGIFSSVSCTQRVNHGMLAVGYGTSQDRGRNVSYWILKNR